MEGIGGGQLAQARKIEEKGMAGVPEDSRPRYQKQGFHTVGVFAAGLGAGLGVRCRGMLFRERTGSGRDCVRHGRRSLHGC